MQDNKVCHHPLPLSLYSRARHQAFSTACFGNHQVVFRWCDYQSPHVPTASYARYQTAGRLSTSPDTCNNLHKTVSTSSDKFIQVFLTSNIILEYFFDIGITFYTAKRMILSQSQYNQWRNCVYQVKTVKRSIVNYANFHSPHYGVG